MCGMLVSRNEVHFGNSAYGVALCMNSLLLVGAIGVFDAQTTAADGPIYVQAKWLALYLQSAACGLQNGMCTAHFGAVVRTTHLTGLTTDSGLTIGRLLSILIRARCNRRNFRPLDRAEVSVDLKKLMVFASLFTGYLAGILWGASMADSMSINALLIPASITGVGGLVYTVLKARCWQVFERVEAEKLAHDLGEAEVIFARALTQISDWKENSPRVSGDLEELDQEVGKALDLLHNMEACLQNRMARHSGEMERTFSSGNLNMARKYSDKSDAARRIHSAPTLLTSQPLAGPVADVACPVPERHSAYAAKPQSEELIHL
eukprot:TRINITY_DN21967_c0_g1_i1.p1 TRINITY_DN21967_c0_g1~~TRINITY_DN21967_c0_g1_i1.p1  ORF type:complete len:320 (-),score=56.64 TRINITY_DN21967_c0_g1_i1:643-1602(-)